jgi:hypothetical protein
VANFSFTIGLSDSEAPAQTASRALTLKVAKR